MSILAYIVLLAVSGLLVGALARLALPGRDPMSLLQTMLVGIAGSFLAGLVYAVIFNRGGGGIVLAVLFSTVIVYLIRRSRGGTLTRPAGADTLDGGRRGAGLFGGARRR